MLATFYIGYYPASVMVYKDIYELFMLFFNLHAFKFQLRVES